jgi:hypothetical protein
VELSFQEHARAAEAEDIPGKIVEKTVAEKVVESCFTVRRYE